MDSFAVDPNIANLIWDRSPIIIALIDENGSFVYVNHQAQHFWEYTEAELRKKSWKDITHPEDLPADIKMHELLRAGKIPHYTMCKRYITKSGRVVWASLNVHLLKDSNDNFMYYLSQVVPLDMMHHVNDEQLDKIANNNKELGKKNPMAFIVKNMSWLAMPIFMCITGVMVFFGDFRASEVEINNMKEKITQLEKLPAQMDKMEMSIDKLTEILEKIEKNKVEKP